MAQREGPTVPAQTGAQADHRHLAIMASGVGVLAGKLEREARQAGIPVPERELAALKQQAEALRIHFETGGAPRLAPAAQPGDVADGAPGPASPPPAPPERPEAMALVALDMAFAGHGREQIADYLHDTFGIEAAGELLDETLGVEEPQPAIEQPRRRRLRRSGRRG